MNNKIAKIKVTSICNKGLINKSDLKFLNIKNFNNLMIVAHPDDETLWGGKNLIKDDFFVVCLTNGYNKPYCIFLRSESISGEIKAAKQQEVRHEQEL